MNTVGITRVSETDEYRVFWRDERGKDDEAKAYYTDDPEDAVNTAIAVVEDLQSKGKEAELSPAKYTRDIVAKYRSDWMTSQAQQVARPTKVERLAEFEDIQDKLFSYHPDELDKVYIFLEKVSGKRDPSPARVVARFKYVYPELYQSTIGEE